MIELRHEGKFVLFDFETENTNLCYMNRPWQFAYLIFKGNKILKKEDIYIHWDDINVSEGAKKVTGFDYAKYKRLAQPAEEVMKKMESLFNNEDHHLAGHNILGFDVLIYQNARRSLGLEPDYSFNNRIVDTLCLEKALHLNVELNYERLFIQQVGMAQTIIRGTKMTLGALSKKYDAEASCEKIGRYHDASFDIEINKGILTKQLWNAKI